MADQSKTILDKITEEAIINLVYLNNVKQTLKRLKYDTKNAVGQAPLLMDYRCSSGEWGQRI